MAWEESSCAASFIGRSIDVQVAPCRVALRAQDTCDRLNCYSHDDGYAQAVAWLELLSEMAQCQCSYLFSSQVGDLRKRDGECKPGPQCDALTLCFFPICRLVSPVKLSLEKPIKFDFMHACIASLVTPCSIARQSLRICDVQDSSFAVSSHTHTWTQVCICT